jgi:hypothetical protein
MRKLDAGMPCHAIAGSASMLDMENGIILIAFPFRKQEAEASRLVI